MQRYGRQLRNLDAWFQSIRKKHAGKMACGQGCARCCYGLFDISLPEALFVVHAFDCMPETLQSEVKARALDIQERIMNAAPELKEPYFLNGLSGDRIDAIAIGVGDIRCPFLGEKDVCLIYEQRPMACRLEGVPMVDAQDGLFGDWCGLNFREGIFPELERDLCLDYYELQVTERAVTGDLAQYFLSYREPSVTLFIPSAIAAAGVFRTGAFQCLELKQLPDQ